ncbi:hypothetical protein [Paracraurococcus ruber]|uniref:hypothetical protein n=1 Tax=Paracraurococcus ruber TaxID=77675 RepID=UPI00130534EE|nr:hypothetical protein [Paracraurococcus ruber]
MSVSLGGSKLGVRRTVVLAAVVAALFCTMGWVSMGRTPAAQRVVDTVKPYDPLP